MQFRRAYANSGRRLAIWQSLVHYCHMATRRISEQATKVVRKVLLDQGHTQEWLATETGIPMRTLARRLHNTNPSPMSLDELGAVAIALGTDIVSLLVSARDGGETTMDVAS